MSERSAAIGLASAKAGSPPPNISARSLAMNDQVTASTRPEAASTRRASHVRFCNKVRIGCATRAIFTRHRGRSDAIDAGNAQDFFDEIGLAFDIGTPGRHAHEDAVGIAGVRQN